MKVPRCCKEELSYKGCFDNGTRYAYNLYMCRVCGKLFKWDVWDNPGLIVIDINCEVKTYSSWKGFHSAKV